MLQVTVSTDPLTESNCYILTEGMYTEGAHTERAHTEGALTEISGCVVIDPGESENLLRLLEEKKWEPELLLLTHEHCDHMAGMDAVRDRYPGARFAATDVCNEGIQNTRLNMSRVMEVYLYFRGKPGIHYDPFVCGAADEIIAPDAVLDWHGHKLRYIPMPGHSPGSAGIFVDEVIFFSGDYLIPGEELILRFPGGDEEACARVTEPFLRSIPKGTRIYPGHGDSFVWQGFV